MMASSKGYRKVVSFILGAKCDLDLKHKYKLLSQVDKNGD